VKLALNNISPKEPFQTPRSDSKGTGELNCLRAIAELVVCSLTVALVQPSFSQAKFQPKSGCYIGAFVQPDNNVNGDIATFENERWTGKKHTGYLTYSAYGKPFPQAYAEKCKATGAFIQIGFEPDTLAAVSDGPYLRRWARAAQKMGVPVFLRYASEMNGEWVPWFGKPTLYKEKWRIVHRVMREEAPNVAMVWCANWSPNVVGDSTRSIMPYYPGDEYVDWVAGDFYMWGPYWDTHNQESGIDVRTKLSIVYNMFPNKPFMICEWGAAHQEFRPNATQPTDTHEYCIDNMNKIYQNLAAQFPRVGGVFWFDYDSHTTNQSNFLLTDDLRVLSNYRSVISSDYFLSNANWNVPRINITSPAESSVVKGQVSVEATIVCDDAITSATLYANKRLVSRITQPPWTLTWNTASFPDTTYELEVWAEASNGFNSVDRRTVVLDNNNDYVSIIIDNRDPSFAYAGGWSSTSQPDRYGPDYIVIPVGDGSSFATWRFSVPTDGDYDISAWWSISDNRAIDAPFYVNYAGGSTVVRVDQTINGGQWNWIGRYTFVAGTPDSIVLRNDAHKSPTFGGSAFVIADAVRLVHNSSLLIDGVRFENAPKQFALFQNYPNPFNPRTTIAFQIPDLGGTESQYIHIQLRVYDLLGREVARLINEKRAPGQYRVEFDGCSSPSGVYFYRLSASIGSGQSLDHRNDPIYIAVKKMALLK
jgi:hypothetical protein